MPGDFEYGDLPPGCPPDDAIATAFAPAYYYCYTIPPTNADFKPLAATGGARPFRSPEELCQASGISLFRDLKDARGLRAVPKFREMVLVELRIEPTDGVTKPTPNRDRPSHHTFWAYRANKVRETVRPVMPDELR
jgi:hypothetical protein